MPKFLDVTDKALARTTLAVVSRGDVGCNVKDFNAKGDSVTDDTNAIHAARNAAGVNGTVYFPPGTYKINALSANVSGQTWNLGSATLIYTGANNAHAITVAATDVTIIGGTLDLSAIEPWSQPVTGQPQPTWRSFGILVDAGSHGVTLRDITITDAPGHGIYVLNTSDVTITGCEIINQTFYGIASQNTDGEVADYFVCDNLISTDSVSFGTGIYLRSEANCSMSRAVVSRNRVVLPPGSSQRDIDYGDIISAAALSVFRASDSIIDGNSLYGGWASITCPQMVRTTFSNNMCRGWWKIGLETGGDSLVITGNILDAQGFAEQDSAGIQTSNFPSNNVTITGNTITGFTKSGVNVVGGIFFGPGATITDVSITGNNITAGGGSGQYYGIVANCTTTNLTIASNTFDCFSRDASRGVYVVGKTHAGMAVVGNSFANCSDAAYFLGDAASPSYTDINFTGNHIRNCGAEFGGPSASSVVRLRSAKTIKDINGATIVSLAPSADAKNHVEIANSPSGGWATVQARSDTDASVNLGISGQGPNGFVGITAGSGDNIVQFLPSGSAVNYLKVTNAATGNPVTFYASGSDNDVSLNLVPQGSGTIQANGVPVVTTTGSQSLSQKSLTAPKIDTIKDANAKTLVNFNYSSSAVNYVEISNADTGGWALIQSRGSDQSVNLAISSQGPNGIVGIINGAGENVAQFRTSTVGNVANYFKFQNAVSGSPVLIQAVGSDNSVDIDVQASGTVKVNGLPIVTTTGSQTITQKRINARVVSVQSAANITPDVSAGDIYAVTGLTNNKLTINVPSGTPADGNKLIFRIKDAGVGRQLEWNAAYREVGVSLPTGTTANKNLYVTAIYNAADNYWDVVDLKQEA